MNLRNSRENSCVAEIQTSEEKSPVCWDYISCKVWKNCKLSPATSMRESFQPRGRGFAGVVCIGAWDERRSQGRSERKSISSDFSAL